MKYIYLFILLVIFSACENEKVHLKITSPEGLVQEWNRAINDRRWDILNGLYADEVYYYSKKRSKEQCVKRKIKSIEKDNSFTQKIGKLQIVDTYYNVTNCSSR